jgi:hypothetical protein
MGKSGTCLKAKKLLFKKGMWNKICEDLGKVWIGKSCKKFYRYHDARKIETVHFVSK